MSAKHLESKKLFNRNRKYIPGGVVSVNRAVEPEIAFGRGKGSRIWDVDGNEYIDYHAAFSPYFLGHNDRYVNEAVKKVLEDESSLFGSGTTALEGRLAELVCEHVPGVEAVQVLSTGSEATQQAIRLARAYTSRNHIIKMQGGYDGWEDDVAGNLMTPLDELGPRKSPGEYPFMPISAGIPRERQGLTHSVNFNDLESVRYVCERYAIAALIVEPILQNIGIVKPLPGYLAGLQSLADEFGFALIFDEVKTGFRHALGGYASIAHVKPDLSVFGKAIGNGFPIAVLGGKRDLMDRFVDPVPERRVLLAGTYNAHPVPTAAAIATIERLLMNDGAVYSHVEELGEKIERGIKELLADESIRGVVARQGSAFCIYFMDHEPVDWHDLASHHDFELDRLFRLALIDRGIYFFPHPVKQCSISAAHTESDIDLTLIQIDKALRAALEARSQEDMEIRTHP